MAYFDRQPVIYPLQRILEEILSGEIRIPQFQRPGTEDTWTPVQRGDLIDSLLRQFPVGTIMLWSTDQDVKCLGVVGGAVIPEKQKGRPLRLVLDGHQRLSTLVRLLGPALRSYVPASGADVPVFTEDWRYDARDESNNKPTTRERIFDAAALSQEECTKRATKAISLACVLDRIQVNNWIRDSKARTLTDGEIARVDALRDGLREYQIPVVTLVASSLEDATESFKRVNSSGTPMSAKHMVGALAYSDQFDLFEAIKQKRAATLDDQGWAEMDDTDLLRICAGILRERDGQRAHHPAKLAISELATALRSSPQLVDDAVAAAADAARVLRAAGVHGPEVLPYAWQIIILAIALKSMQVQEMTAAQRSAAIRWFWRTTYGAVFQGVNSAIVDRALHALTESLNGGEDMRMSRDLSLPVGRPGKCDFRTMRTRAALLALAREQDGLNVNGPAHRALTLGTSGVMQLFPARPRSDLGNLHIEADPERRLQVRNGLKTPLDLVEHPGLVGVACLTDADRAKPPEEVVAERGQNLWLLEREFIRSWGLEVVDS